ncbi:MAG: 50S ribosomal protein L4 [Rhodospirillaceae bacterium]|nr:50S ribosomal protein L4 [Rhodospirillaceae bacterium]
MKVQLYSLDNQQVGEIDLSDHVFGLPSRKDLLSRTINWQLAKRRSGNHKSKEIGDISGTTKKPWAQKGTGQARQGSLRSPQFRKGAVIFGPVVRSHAHDLNKKVRKLALKTALSVKQAEGKLLILDNAALDSAKTKDLAMTVEKFGWKSVLLIDGNELNENLVRASSSLSHFDILPQQGANVYDILRHDMLVLTQSAVRSLEERLA